MGLRQSTPYREPDTSDLAQPKTAEEVGYKLVKVHGVPQNPLFDVTAFESLVSTFKARQSDVFICTYVKAGTTWTQQIVTNLVHGGSTSKKYGEVVPWLEALCATKILPEREAPGWTLESVDSAVGPRYFKSHANVRDLPGGASTPKVIVIARNPKDTIVSLYHHAKNKPEFEFAEGTFDDFLRVFISGNAENGSWFSHVVEWHQKAATNPSQYLFLKYEDMKHDPVAATRKIADLIGVNAEPDVIQRAVQNSTMSAMKSNKNANIGLGHLRKGEIGKWRETFTVAQSELFDEVYKKKMAGTGIVFDFGEGLRM